MISILASLVFEISNTKLAHIQPFKVIAKNLVIQMTPLGLTLKTQK